MSGSWKTAFFRSSGDRSDHVRATSVRTAPKGSAADQTLRQQVDELLAAARRGDVNDACARLLLAAERELFSRAIELADGNQARAARWAGVSRLTMREKLRHFGLHPHQDGGADSERAE